jgi:hypothetical protein
MHFFDKLSLLLLLPPSAAAAAAVNHPCRQMVLASLPSKEAGQLKLKEV